MSLRERALAARNVRSEIVTVPDWADPDGSGDVKLVGLTAAQRLRLVKLATVTKVTTTKDGASVSEDEVDNGLLYPLLITAGARDPSTDTALFTEGDSDALMGNTAGVIENLAGIILRLSGMTKDAQLVLEKNSAPTPSVATATA
jgi:hypothetical protein